MWKSMVLAVCLLVAGVQPMEDPTYGVKLCGREFIRAVIFTCGGSRWKRSLRSAGESEEAISSSLQIVWCLVSAPVMVSNNYFTYVATYRQNSLHTLHFSFNFYCEFSGSLWMWQMFLLLLNLLVLFAIVLSAMDMYRQIFAFCWGTGKTTVIPIKIQIIYYRITQLKWTTSNNQQWSSNKDKVLL